MVGVNLRIVVNCDEWCTRIGDAPSMRNPIVGDDTAEHAAILRVEDYTLSPDRANIGRPNAAVAADDGYSEVNGSGRNHPIRHIGNL